LLTLKFVNMGNVAGKYGDWEESVEEIQTGNVAQVSETGPVVAQIPVTVDPNVNTSGSTENDQTQSEKVKVGQKRTYSNLKGQNQTTNVDTTQNETPVSEVDAEEEHPSKKSKTEHKVGLLDQEIIIIDVENYTAYSKDELSKNPRRSHRTPVKTTPVKIEKTEETAKKRPRSSSVSNTPNKAAKKSPNSSPKKESPIKVNKEKSPVKEKAPKTPKKEVSPVKKEPSPIKASSPRKVVIKKETPKKVTPKKETLKKRDS